MAESKTLLTPLSGSNYSTWKVQCKMALMKDGVWKIVEGTETAPREEDASYAKFVERRDRALAIVVLAIDPALLYLIGEPTDPNEVWTKLENQFQTVEPPPSRNTHRTLNLFALQITHNNKKSH